ncbi:MAG TPA: methyltransferase domain-containing protein [Candidatus Binataceae bacterium]|nr:methyltransferase domain-containing protein [Candidatus Binataceae bacterium]
MAAWHEDDRFWETFQGYMFNPARVAAAKSEVDAMLVLLGVAPKSSILDLCCGPGRHSLEFARRGFLVTGVDRTKDYLRQAREQGAMERLQIEFVESDMRNFVRADAFDAAINFFTAFGYFDDPAEDRQVVANVHRSLRAGGKFLVDVNGKEILARKFRERDWNPRDDGSVVLEERRVVDGWTRVENRWTWIRGTERRESTFTLRLYSGAELRELLRSVGFGKVELFGSLAGADYDHNAERLIAVATR